MPPKRPVPARPIPARCQPFTPATKLARFDTTAASGADALMLDLEDGVAQQAKIDARRKARRTLATPAVATCGEAV